MSLTIDIQAGQDNVPALTGNIFATATNRSNLHSKRVLVHVTKHPINMHYAVFTIELFICIELLEENIVIFTQVR
jgi:hypothetical protein